jgi:TnpA family transposase
MHNEVGKSDLHSTDALGFSEWVFAVSHLLGFSYADRFKNLKRQRRYIFRRRKGSDRSVWKIKPNCRAAPKSRIFSAKSIFCS